MSEKKEKKSKTLLYVLGGCAILFIIGIIMVGAFLFIFGKKINTFFSKPSESIAKIITQSNPDVEIISIDEENKKITIKNKKTGEILTIDFFEAEKGKIFWRGKEKEKLEISSNEGEGKIEFEEEGEKTTITYSTSKEEPKWFPHLDGYEFKSILKSKKDNEIYEMAEFKTSKKINEVISEFESAFKDFNFIKSTFEEGNKKQISLHGKDKENKKNIIIYVFEEEKEVKGTISYSEKF